MGNRATTRTIAPASSPPRPRPPLAPSAPRTLDPTTLLLPRLLAPYSPSAPHLLDPSTPHVLAPHSVAPSPPRLLRQWIRRLPPSPPRHLALSPPRRPLLDLLGFILCDTVGHDPSELGAPRCMSLVVLLPSRKPIQFVLSFIAIKNRPLPPRSSAAAYSSLNLDVSPPKGLPFPTASRHPIRS
jgi:hypothetical protein